MILQLYDDDEDSNYPMIEIKDDGEVEFLSTLEKYRKRNRGSYNIDDFIELIEPKKWFIRTISNDGIVYF